METLWVAHNDPGRGLGRGVGNTQQFSLRPPQFCGQNRPINDQILPNP